MLFVVLGFFAGIPLALYLFRTSNRQFNTGGGWLTSLMIGSMFAALGIIPAMIIGEFLPLEYRLDQSYELYSLRQGDTLGGQFFLGSGSISGQEMYYYNIAHPDGSYSPEELSTNNYIRVHEEDRSDGRLDVYRTHLINNNFIWLGLPPDTRYQYHFYIPNGSLERNYILH